ncbi:uncharacterized protein LOC131532582 isoform X2 [Onychostoma macrolepis]|uniref:uncharacterized protein LOC131532582 isoform X2 n=1 Tax=Onychostoma macrolepis TaxID=369639 RepID=UPI00272CF641|nr:uncharacterized protein LOC131532582 isoform X2 [Onychostoma macrolepis]
MHFSVSLLSFQPQHRERAVHSSTVLQKHCEMCFNFSTKCVIAGLLLSLIEAKIYTKTIIKKSEVGENGQVMVCIGDKLVAQYFCNAGICWNETNTVGQLIEQSGNLVLIMQNISSIDRFDAFHNQKPILRNFTLDEVLPTSAAPDLTDEDVTLKPSITRTVLRTSAAPDLTDGGLNPSITPTVPPTSTTPTLAEEALNQRHLEPRNKTGTTKALIVVALALAAVVVLVAIRLDLKSGRNGRIARAIAFFRRGCCDPVPNQHDGNSVEMQSLAAPV